MSFLDSVVYTPRVVCNYHKLLWNGTVVVTMEKHLQNSLFITFFNLVLNSLMILGLEFFLVKMTHFRILHMKSRMLQRILILFYWLTFVGEILPNYYKIYSQWFLCPVFTIWVKSENLDSRTHRSIIVYFSNVVRNVLEHIQIQ